MATPLARKAPPGSDLPLYRMGVGTYDRLARAGALEGLEVELRDGLLVERAGAIHLLDTDTYNRMVATGALDDEPLELLDGLLVAVSQQGPAHAAAIMRLTRHLATAEAWLRVQLPLEVRPRSEPEPDLGLLNEPGSVAEHPRTLLVAVEVAVTSQSKDRNRKGRLYAQAGVPTYWLVDVPRETVEVRSDPNVHDGYERCELYRVGDRVPSPAAGVPDLDVAWLFRDAAD